MGWKGRASCQRCWLKDMDWLMDLPWQSCIEVSKHESKQVRLMPETASCHDLLDKMEANGMDMNAIYEMLRDSAIETIGCSLDDDGK